MSEILTPLNCIVGKVAKEVQAGSSLNSLGSCNDKFQNRKLSLQMPLVIFILV